MKDGINMKRWLGKGIARGTISLLAIWVASGIAVAAQASDQAQVILEQLLDANNSLLDYASDATAADDFGYSVAISGNTAIVGAHGNDDVGLESGSAYLFDITTGNQLAKLTASDAAARDWFGRSVAISDNTAIVGAYGDGGGSAYLFDITTGNQLAKLTASDAATDDLFGYSVAISGNTAIVGACFDDDAGDWSGSAYLFEGVPEPATLGLVLLGGLALLRRKPL